MGSFDIGQDNNTGAPEIIGGAGFGDEFVVHYEAVRMDHHASIAREIFALTGNQDSRVRYARSDQRFGPDQILQSFVFPDASEEENQVFFPFAHD